MTSAQEARADGWQRDTAKLLATVRALARENRELRARVAELEAAHAPQKPQETRTASGAGEG